MKGRNKEGKEGENVRCTKYFLNKEEKGKDRRSWTSHRAAQIIFFYTYCLYTYTHTHTHTHTHPMGRGGWWATVIGLQRVGHDLATK